MQKHILTCSDFHRKLGSTLFLSSSQFLLERLYPQAPHKRLAIALSVQQLALDKPASPSSLGIHVTALPRSCLCFCLVGSNPQMVPSFLFFTKLSIICVCFIMGGGVQYTANTTRMKTEGHGREHQVLRSEDSLAGISTIMF